jgi:hypothetical protein
MVGQNFEIYDEELKQEQEEYIEYVFWDQN